ncbi:MAG: CDP-alcohol phosphatidyltransferase family protein [Thermoplasmata archaeon]|nr:MAG: CDP-alcohol phosphatidyltransferase family protein [Thermoplasmata archaeon]RLF73823.1 MAG: CDP-alcohol phosphatidyltransferase family protein [Thermoplasmata archaeon]RLF74958.1 MAG: CDP-alcohol phosphatidyltransferase family protein [Thermoplasmata archaeon]HDD60224.1 CDP-alcohol phosphatidyltransferase family protein [Euryarchaeota archaeon]
MVLNKYRKQADTILLPLARKLKGVSPNALSAASLLFAVLAALFFYFSSRYTFSFIGEGGEPLPWLLVAGSVMVMLNGLFDALDGKVARLTGRASEVGDFLDHVIDRLADIIMVGGLAYTPYTNRTLGLTAVIFMLVVSYMGTQAQALGCGRNYRGIMGRAERLVLLMIIPPLQVAFLSRGASGELPYIHLTLIDLLMYILLVGSALTALQRGVDTYRELKERESGE